MRNKAKEGRDIAGLISMVLSMFAFILLIVASMFSSYSANISENEKIIIDDKNIVISYSEGNEVYLKNITPGTTKHILFEISSKEDATSIMEYDIVFFINDNTFNPEYIMYKLDGTSSLKSDSGNMASVSELTNFVNYDTPHFKGSIKPGEVQKYDLYLYYSTLSRVNKNLLKGYVNVEVKGIEG